MKLVLGTPGSGSAAAAECMEVKESFMRVFPDG
jgi:hypothetical protein